jgi:arsenate reductase-like glutaredoxin family protein
VRAWLSQRGVELDEREFFQNRLSEEELRGLIGDVSPREVFSWKSPSFKNLGLDPNALTDEQLIAMMVDEPRLIRRPLVVVDGRLIDGRDDEALTEALL